MKRKLIAAAKKTPLVGKYLRRYRSMKRQITDQQDHITSLREAIDRLEKRNEQWADEVRRLRGDGQSLSIVWPVKEKDLLAVDWQRVQKSKPHHAKPPFTINWVVPPPGPSAVSGGHEDIFRTIQYLEAKGHTCRVYFYDALETTTLEAVRENLKNYPAIKAELFYNAEEIADADAIFATNWHTAYPVFNHKGTAKKYYYVQDFEPYFDPVGAYSTLAENTYRFGLRGLTLGRWLTEKLSAEYGMTCDYFELGSNQKEYYQINVPKQKKVFFYVRPTTPRRGFELGVLALQLFHKKHPDYEIHFVGWDMTPYKIPFPYINRGVMKHEDLNRLYNECATGLVLSFTNMSLVPLEMLMAGCVPVVNDAPHTQAVGYAEGLKYAPPNPAAIAAALYEVATAKNAGAEAEQATAIAKTFHWDESNAKIEKILIDELSA